MKTSLCAVAGLVAAAWAAPLHDRSNYAVHSDHPSPPGWQKLTRASAEHVMTLSIGIKQASFAELERHLYEVSDPGHGRYGQHLSVDDVRGLVAPSDEALASVQDWLLDHDINLDKIDYTPARDWMIVSLPVDRIERLLDTEYHNYEDGNGVAVVRTTAYSLPKHLHEHIDVVQPTNYWGRPKLHGSDVKIVKEFAPVSNFAKATQATQSNANASTVCNPESVSLLCVRTLYNTVDYTPKVPQINSAAITNYLNQTPSDADFHQYLALERPDTSQSYQFSRKIIANAANDQTQPGVEADLDVEAVGGIIYPTKFTSFATGGSPPFTPDVATPTDTNEPYLTFLNYLLTQPVLPNVLSNSYGDDEQTVPLNYAQRVCAEYAQLGARGVTVLHSSGDNGVGQDPDCVSNDGKNKRKFIPEFPASCPFVTAVGGTRGINPEIVAFDTSNGYVAGAGFSEYFTQPGYQAAAVDKYLGSIGPLNAGLYNPAGRAYPDIAAQSYHFQIVYAGQEGLVDGTSVASPITGGVLALVNDALIATGRPPLGFLNPLLYASNGAGFTDITIGNATGCGTSGFPAGKGWDAASGFGTPDLKAIRQALGV